MQVPESQKEGEERAEFNTRDFGPHHPIPWESFFCLFVFVLIQIGENRDWRVKPIPIPNPSAL